MEFLLARWAGASQVLPAPTQYLPAPGRRAMLNVEPWVLNFSKGGLKVVLKRS